MKVNALKSFSDKTFSKINDWLEIKTPIKIFFSLRADEKSTSNIRLRDVSYC